MLEVGFIGSRRYSTLKQVGSFVGRRLNPRSGRELGDVPNMSSTDSARQEGA